MEDLQILKDLRKNCLEASFCGHDGNLQSCFSSLELIWACYDRLMNWSVEKALDENRDYFVCSKGQSTLALFVVLVQKGFLKYDELTHFAKFDSRISMQADRTKFNGGIEISAGSLGHGFPEAVGIALSKKIRKLDGKVFVLVGDGELNEGTMWEGMAFAFAHRLDNLIMLVDNNKSLNKLLDFGSFENKIKAFGFEVCNADGHNINDIIRAYDSLIDSKLPKAIIADTYRGYGSKTLMTLREWFHKSPKDQTELDSLKKEIDTFEPSQINEYRSELV